MVGHALTGITLGPTSFKREQFFARNGGQFAHQLREITILAMLAPIMFVMHDKSRNLDSP
jgi:hypothetical protein